jgi:hypothetical protein
MNQGSVKTPMHLWIVGLVSLLWNAMGAFDYSASQLRLEFYMSHFTQTQLDYFYAFPTWAVAAWAIGVWGSLLGSVGLLLRERRAVWAFGLSIVGLALTTLYSLVLTNGQELMGDGAIIFTAVIWVITLLLLLYSHKMAGRGVLQ